MSVDKSVIVTIVILAAAALIAWAVYWDYRKKRLEFEERRIALENGMTPAPPALPAVAGWPGVKQREMDLKYAERRLMIEKGLAVQEEAQKPKTRLDYLRGGLVFTSLGIGAAVAYILLGLEPIGGSAEARAWCLGLAPFLIMFGVGNLVYQRFLPDPPRDSEGRTERSA
jgi:Flp pilus assembly protein TadB